MIIRLEAIFVSAFVVGEPGRQAAPESVRADLDFETDLRWKV